MPASKNVVLINGVGIAKEATVTSRLVRGRGLVGLRIDATEAMGLSRDDEPAARFCGRLFLMLGGRAVLIVDRAVLPHTGRVESRAHTFASVTTQPAGVLLAGERQHMRVAYACNVPATLHTAVTAPTTPGQSANVLRWCTDGLHTDVVMATLLSPGDAEARVEVERTGRRFAVTVSAGRLRRRVELTARLGLAH